jgi:CRAL/TRIO domain
MSENMKGNDFDARYLAMPNKKEGCKPRSKRRSFPIATSLLCYVVAMALLYKYSTMQRGSVKNCDGTCDAAERHNNKHTKNLLVQLLRDASPVEHYARQSPPETQKFPAQVDAVSTTPPEVKAKITVHFSEGHSTHPDLSTDQLNVLREFSDQVLHTIPDLHTRAKFVGWGGSQAWWTAHTKGGDAIDEIDGGRLLWHYYKIMSRYMKDPSHLADSIHFPFKLCGKHGCSAEQMIQHSLEWREKYQPWRVTAAMLKENESGWVYVRGFSPPADNSHNKHYGRHAIIWLRPGKHRVKDNLTYFRCILNAADRAIGEALHDSHGRVGKYNVVIDGSNYDWSKLPDVRHVKQTITMLQDHYTNRLGMLFVTNLSRPAEFVMNLIKPIITKEVRDKIHILSHDPERRAAELASLIEPEFLPDWLGGPDTYQFDASHYYPKRFYWSDKEGAEFMQTMPYHDVS